MISKNDDFNKSWYTYKINENRRFWTISLNFKKIEKKKSSKFFISLFIYFFVNININYALYNYYYYYFFL